MVNQDKIFCKRLSDLIEWYDPEFKFRKETAKNVLVDLKNKIENSNCPTCDEDEDEVIIKSRKKITKYPPKLWTCPECDVTITTKNRVSHTRSNKHENNISSFICEESE